MSALSLVILGAAWMLVHGAAYALGLRSLPAFRREMVIFLYQAASFCLLMLLGLAWFIHYQTGYAAGIFLVSVHGIYSLSFLELWALSEGGYSLRLLHLIDGGKLAEAEANGNLGAVKLVKRLESLRNLGLLREETGRSHLTLGGRGAAALFGAILWLTAGRSLNR